MHSKEVKRPDPLHICKTNCREIIIITSDLMQQYVYVDCNVKKKKESEE